MSNFLKFAAFDEWDHSLIQGFQYDSISDADIDVALLDFEKVSLINSSLDWEDDAYLMQTCDIPESQKHAYRVAAIVHSIRRHGISSAIELDTYSSGQCCSCVPNGHHRVRALQYLGIDYGPFDLSGSLDALEDLVRLGHTEVRPEHACLFGIHLSFSENDVHI